jgi:hypothetical protein
MVHPVSKLAFHPACQFYSLEVNLLSLVVIWFGFPLMREKKKVNNKAGIKHGTVIQFLQEVHQIG